MKSLISILAVLWLVLGSLSAQAQTAALDLVAGKDAAPSAAQPHSEAELQELVRLLSNPALVERLKQRLPEPDGEQAGDRLLVTGLQEKFQETLEHVENRSRDIVHALAKLHRLPRALAKGWGKNMAASDFLQSAIYVVIFLFGGFGLEWLYWSYLCSAPGSLDTSLSHAAGLIEIAACHA